VDTSPRRPGCDLEKMACAVVECLILLTKQKEVRGDRPLTARSSGPCSCSGSLMQRKGAKHATHRTTQGAKRTLRLTDTWDAEWKLRASEKDRQGIGMENKDLVGRKAHGLE